MADIDFRCVAREVPIVLASGYLAGSDPGPGLIVMGVAQSGKESVTSRVSAIAYGDGARTAALFQIVRADINRTFPHQRHIDGYFHVHFPCLTVRPAHEPVR